MTDNTTQSYLKSFRNTYRNPCGVFCRNWKPTQNSHGIFEGPQITKNGLEKKKNKVERLTCPDAEEPGVYVTEFIKGKKFEEECEEGRKNTEWDREQ